MAEAVEKVAGLLESGTPLDDALVKVAGDAELTPGHIRLVCQAINNGRTNVIRKSATDLFDKSASFKLADAGKVIEALFPGHVKTAAEAHRDTAVSDVYSRPPVPLLNTPVMVKSARALTLVGRAPDPYPREPGRSRKALSLLKEAGRELEQRRGDLSATRDKLAAAFHDLKVYFRQAGGVAVKQAHVNSRLLWGPNADVVFGQLALDDPFVKKAMDGRRPAPSYLDPAGRPYSLVDACIKLARECVAKGKELDGFRKEAARLGKGLNDRLLPDKPYHQGSVLRPMHKEALFGSFLNEALTGASRETGQNVLHRALPKPLDKLKSEAFEDLTSPAHESKMRNVRAQAVLHDMLANDEFLSAEHPDKVVHTYNEIAKLSPRAAEQPMLMRALLRRYMAQGSADPHDIDQMMGIETKLKDRDRPSPPPLLAPVAPPAPPRPVRE